MLSDRSPGCCDTISFVTVYFLPGEQAYNLSLDTGEGEVEIEREGELWLEERGVVIEMGEAVLIFLLSEYLCLCGEFWLDPELLLPVEIE